MRAEPLQFCEAGESSLAAIAGVDEAGRGPLAGTVVAAAVILDSTNIPPGLRDSKKLGPERRTQLAMQIKEQALCYALAEASVEEIEQLNILQASMLAMKRAVQALSQAPDFVYVDGNRCPGWHYQSRAIIKGDNKILAIAAASILAKVTRDRSLLALDKLYPQYGFASHKGYPTPEHLSALRLYGASPVHRRTYAPVREVLKLK
jgi:ribonuclease HII